MQMITTNCMELMNISSLKISPKCAGLLSKIEKIADTKPIRAGMMAVIKILTFSESNHFDSIPKV